MSTQVEKEIEQFKRELLRRRLAQLIPKQRDRFKQIYPKGVPANSLISAIDLCDRTIAKNKECKHEKAHFVQSASGNESWYECDRCGKVVS